MKDYVAIIVALIAAVGSLVNLIYQRKCQREDKSDECKQTLERIEGKLDAHIEADEQDSVRQCRSRIIIFADEISRGVLHSHEHFDCVLDDIDTYERYCASHPNYPNRKAEAAKALIIENYKKRLDKGDWL